MRIEAAVLEGSKNVVKVLQSSKQADKKALQEVVQLTPKIQMFRFFLKCYVSNYIHVQ